MTALKRNASVLIATLGLVSTSHAGLEPSPIPTISEMFVSCRHMLAEEYENSAATTCWIYINAKNLQDIIERGRELCIPSVTKPETRAFVFVDYVQRHYDELKRDLDQPFYGVAAEAYAARWRCGKE